MSSTKTCIKCNKELPLSCFLKRGGENYLRTECKECNNKLSKIRSNLRKKYGPPPVGYTCPICKRGEGECRGQGSKIASSWVVDHCHKTDSFRGWLCHKCNRGLGAFNDDVGTVQRVIKYLKRNQSTTKKEVKQDMRIDENKKRQKTIWEWVTSV